MRRLEIMGTAVGLHWAVPSGLTAQPAASVAEALPVSSSTTSLSSPPSVLCAPQPVAITAAKPTNATTAELENRSIPSSWVRHAETRRRGPRLYGRSSPSEPHLGGG